MMKEEINNEFDDAVKHKLYDYEVEPSRALWSSVEDSFDAAGPVVKKKDGSRYFLLLLAFMSLIGVSATSSYYILNNKSAANLPKHNKIDSNQFASVYNATNNIGASYGATTSNQKAVSSTKFKVDRVVVAGDKTKHIYLTAIPQAKLELASIATENRISNYKDVPNMLISSLNVTSTPQAFNNNLEEVDPDFVSNKINHKGFYLGGAVQSGVNLMTKNNTQNKMLGSNTVYTPTAYTKAGIVLGYNITKNVGVQSGLAYVNRSVRYSSNLYDAITSGELKLNFVEMPLIVKYKTNWIGSKNRTNSLNFYSGVAYTYLVRAEAKFDNKKLFNYGNQSYSAKKYLPNHNLNFIAGIEYQVYVRDNVSINIGAEANYGGSANEVKNWAQKNTTAFTNIGLGVNTTITFSTKKVK